MGKDKEKSKSFRSRQQPASSSQAAALLGGQPGEFIGFSAFTPMLELEQNLPGEYTLCFKKMNKKDTITKVKALNEFVQLLTNTPLTETEEHKILLQNWVSSYTKLSTDPARQVREAAQQAMGKLATVVKKQLGPHLKSLLPYWLAARFDPSREVARAAIEALQQAIPPHKHSEALKFVGKDILLQCKESFLQTPQSFSDAKTPPELAQERYERVMSTFMMSIAYLAETLAPEDNATFSEQYQAIFLDAGFWKFLSNKSPTIRRAAYNLVPVVGKIAKQTPPVQMEGVVALLTKDVLGLFSDKDPSTHQALWDAVLSFTTSFPQSWEVPSVDIRKHVFPRLFAFLRAGTYGSLTYPSLLPFLSVVPPSLRNVGFYSQFFGNMWQGYASESISKQGRPAAQAFLQGYLECISFAASSNNNNTSLTEEEKSEAEVYIYQEGIWHVLNHYLSAELVLYVDEFFVENFCKYTSKLFSTSPADGPNKFWKKFIEVSDSLLTSTPQIFCPRLIALLHGFANSSTQVPSEVQQHLFTKASDPALAVSSQHLELATALVKLWPLNSLVEDATMFWNMKLLPWLTEWLTKGQSSDSIRSLLSLLSVYLSKSEHARTYWDSLLRILVSYFKDTYEYFLFILGKVAHKGDSSKWRSAHLDSLVVPLLPNGDLHSLVSPAAASRILLALISNDVVERETLRKLGTSLKTYLESKPPVAAPSQAWGLDVIKALVGSKLAILTETDAHPSDHELISDLLVAFLDYVLHARDDNVLAAWQMRVGKQLDTEQAAQIRLRLLNRLRDHVSGETAFRYHPSLGFTPDAESWTEELVVCQVAAQEISTGFPVSQAFAELVRKDEWLAASVSAAQALSTNYVDTNVSPILPVSSLPSTEIELFLKLSLINLAFVRGLGVSAICAEHANLWLAAQIECVRIIANSDLLDASAHAWWDGAQRLRDAVNDTINAGVADASAAHADAVLECTVELAQTVGGIYIFVLEKIAEKLANSWDKDSGLVVLARFVLPLETEALEKDEALGRMQALLPHLIPQLENPLPALIDLRNKYIQVLQESIDYKRTTRILEGLYCLISTAFPLTLPEIILILGFFSRFSRAPPKLQDETFTAKRLEFIEISSENWKLLKMRAIDWVKVTSADPISVLLRYQATKLFSELDAVFSAESNVEKEQVKELDWSTARSEAQQAVSLQLVNARTTPTTQGTNRLFSFTTYVFRTLPISLVEPHISKLYSLLHHANIDVQIWAHNHLLSIVSTPIPETATPSLAPELQQFLRDSSAWEHIFEEDDPPVVRLPTNKTATISSVFGHLLAWDVLVHLLSANNTQVRSQISSTFLREGVPSPVTVFLQNIFKYIQIYSAKGKNTTYPAAVTHFRVEDLVNISGLEVGVFCGALYVKLLQCVPGVVRLWWTDDCEKRMSPFVDTYTTAHASPVIIEKELSLVNKHGTKPMDDFSIYTIPRTREVVATYRKDEMVVEIALTLSANYPLRACSIAMNQHLNVGEALWRKWLLGMTTLLLTSEGDLLDACLLWKNSLDQHFEGVEVCPICYSLFNAGQLPKLQCRTCKNKFHSSCMYKWFSTSHKSTCPLCQTDFQSM